jgi:DNA recombination protein RmuC
VLAFAMDNAILLLAAAVVIGGVAIIIFTLSRLRSGADMAGLANRIGELAKTQSEIAGRFTQAIESQSKGSTDLQKAVNERLDALDARLGENLKAAATTTAETLGGLQQRLKIIDEAQRNLTELSSGLSTNVLGLQQILSNKQSRGAYGQGQMEAIVRDALPAGLYEFQATLTNKSRPDCLIRLPDTKAGIVIDSKFPLEGFELLKAAANDAERKLAAARIRNDVLKHVKDIAEKYLIVGETQDPAIMFVPSESIYAELYDGFSDVIQQAHRARVVIVSPNILLLAISTIKTVMKDARMREQAYQIQREVGLLLDDVNRLQTRVGKLQSHFNQAEGDVKDILTSTEKVTKRAAQIEQVDLSPEGAAAAPSLPFAEAG